MRYVFFGTPRFAEVVLKKLIEENLAPDMVVCNPDRPVGRDQILTPPPTKELAQKHDIPVYQPEKLTLKEFKSKIPDNVKVSVLAAYGKIIPKEIIDFFPKGIVGVHPSLLPKYRGPTPIRSAMLEGEEETGVSLFLMDEKVDHGPVLGKEYLEANNTTYVELRDDLANLGARMVISLVPDYLSGNLSPEPQDHSKATLTSFFDTDDAEVDYNDLKSAINGDLDKAKKINRMIRALNPEPGTWTKTSENQILSLPKSKRVKLLESHIDDNSLVLDKIHVAGKPEPRTP